ncbi:hypothetical protein D0T53_04575 [Dysgonomonas sp. 216]|uniref:translocation and assembly module lipoprotein TamL n=1 Tax=Dysgonomonas sp. 216 TaxID=2302934 RepID=UPI0013D1F258|nr:BamA/TamA family outer membrane protein [Dysgonomonas sp. 216]NDW18193.1 hypothetical protein [Dysgonomonas sp. 216]
MKNAIYILLVIVLASCSTSKNIPEGRYLLDKYTIKSDNKKIDVAYLEDYVRQTPNSSLPLLGKVRLKIYNMAGQDTSKWLTRVVRKLGKEPVLYSASQTNISANQIQKELSNQGYLNAQVDTLLRTKDKKIEVTYQIQSGTPYTIRKYEYTIDNQGLARILNRTKRISQVKTGELFDQELLETERERQSNILRNVGYESFSKENLYFRADTTLNSHQVDLFLTLRETPDSLAFSRFKFRNITILSGYDVTNNENDKYFANPDTIITDGITIVRGSNNFLRTSTLLRNNYIRPDKYYSDYAGSRTFSAFNGIGIIRQTNINYTEVPTSDSIQFIDARITLAPGNIHWFQAGLEGTNSAGDIGVAPSVAYQHRNLFNGAEIFTVKLRGAYEFITGTDNTDLLGQNYYEYGIETSLSFPQFLFPWLKKSWREQPSASTQFSVGLTNQHRPEYTRQFFNGKITYRWSSSRNRLNHTINLIDINYIRMPWTSTAFNNYLTTDILKETYKDQLIARTGYNITFTKSSGFRFPKNSYTIRASVETAGWLPSLVATMNGATKNNEGQKEIVGVAYADYIKGTFSFSHTRTFDRKQSFAYNVALGVANPYGNSNILPYEQRFFSGGANSVRGWSTRTLGPGIYNDTASFINQAGDIKLDLNIEYRYKMTSLFEIAGFVDAGNIWTIKNYEGQKGGLFKFNEFYKEIAASYGAGLRVDLGFLLLRLDTGMKAYDPARDEGDRFIMFKPRLRNMAWHFAIGYPF